MKQYLSIFFATLLIFIGLSSCGESAKEKADRMTKDSIRTYDSLIKPRKEIYDAAVTSIKELLKVPKTAQFPAIALQNDTVKIKSNDSKAWVVFPYDAQNPMGTFMHDIAEVSLVKSNGKWVPANGYFAVNASTMKDYYSGFDQYAEAKLGGIMDNSNGSTPAPPTPAPAPVPPPMPSDFKH